jgi:hypothetical protein
MSEADLLMLHIELLNNAWTVLFTWIGTTTAMVGAAFFVSTRIKISLLVAMLSLYAIFSAACSAQVIQTWRRILTVGEDLVGLQENGVQLTQSASLLIANLESRLVVSIAGPLMLVVFIASIIYVIHCYKGGGAG